MPRRVKPRWGCRAAVCVQGFGQTDDQLVERGIALEALPRGQRGCVQSDAEFSRLAAHLKVKDPALLAKARAKLDSCREFYLTSRLYEANRPMQRELNAALRLVRDRIGSFRDAISALGQLPDWTLIEAGAIENPSHFFVFATLSQRLRVLASTGKKAWKGIAPAPSPDSEPTARLRSLCDCAALLADTLFALDHASQDDVIQHLPSTRDYNAASLSQVVSILQRLHEAVGKALASDRAQGGPRPFPELAQTIAWLGEVYEDLGGRFTHTPRLKTEYDARPHSAAGGFVTEFFRFCDPKLPAHSISSAMAEVIERRKSQLASA
jgi:hypothetical protein